MPAITEVQLKDKIKSKQLDKLYMIYGDDTYMKSYYCKKLASVASPVMPEFNLITLNYNDVSFDDIFNSIETLPMFAETKCVVINDFNAESTAASETEKLTGLLSDIPETTVVIISLINIKPDLKKSAKWRNFIKIIDQYGYSVNIQNRTDVQLNKMLIKYAGDKGCVLDKNNAAYLIELCLGNLQTLLIELDKLCALASGSTITRQIIDKLVVKSLTASVFDLSRAVTSKDYTRAFDILNSLISQKYEPVNILAQLSNAFVDIYRVKCALEGSASPESIGKDYNYRGREFILRNAQRDASRLDMAIIRRCLSILVEADCTLKSSRNNQQIVLEQTVAELIVTIKKA